MIVSKTLFFHMNLPDLFYENVPSMNTLLFGEEYLINNNYIYHISVYLQIFTKKKGNNLDVCKKIVGSANKTK